MIVALFAERRPNGQRSRSSGIACERYFSSTWWRQLKQRLVDHLKQRARLALLAREPGAPLMAPEVIEGHLSALIRQLSRSQRRLCLLGLLPVGEATFPGSPAQFDQVRRMLADLAARSGTGFFQPLGSDSRPLDDPSLYYLDLFHPNAEGSRRIAESLLTHLDAD